MPRGDSPPQVRESRRPALCGISAPIADSQPASASEFPSSALMSPSPVSAYRAGASRILGAVSRFDAAKFARALEAQTKRSVRDRTRGGFPREKCCRLRRLMPQLPRPAHVVPPYRTRCWEARSDATAAPDRRRLSCVPRSTRVSAWFTPEKSRPQEWGRCTQECVRHVDSRLIRPLPHLQHQQRGH